MEYGGTIRERFRNPWHRNRPQLPLTPEERDQISNKYCRKWRKFSSFTDNQDMDVRTKLAAMKVSSSVVSVVSSYDYSEEEEEEEEVEEEPFRCCSGIVIGEDTILTCATLIKSPNEAAIAIPQNLKVVVRLSDGQPLNAQIVAYDFHYNLLVVMVQPEVPLTTAVLRRIDDSFSVALVKEPSQPHSDAFNLIPGKKVIALGRYFTKPYELMAACGEFSLGRCRLLSLGDGQIACTELFKVNCQTTMCGIGGPIINYDGEVIGINFWHVHFTPFLPINIAIKWWDHYKKYRVTRPPQLKMQVTNLYVAQLHILEKVVLNFPGVLKGAFVEQVKPGSSAYAAGICFNDVIVQCNGQKVQSFLELLEIIWDKVGEPVELVVLRVGHDGPLHLSMLVEGATSDQFYDWPIWDDLSSY